MSTTEVFELRDERPEDATAVASLLDEAVTADVSGVRTYRPGLGE